MVTQEDVDYLSRHLKEVPAFRALLRSIECRLLSQVELPRPLLDLGCGDGHFASMLFDRPVEVGLDSSFDCVAEAKGRGVYRQLIVASGAALPYADGTFASVLSNCVLEHIPDLEATLREVHRVWRGDGIFAFTVPSQNFTRFLFFPTLFRRLGLSGLAQRYERWFNAISRHYHCYGPEIWQEKLAAAGVEVLEWRYYMSSTAHRLFDLGHYYAAPTLLTHRLLGRWVLCSWRGNFALVEAVLRRCYEEQGLGEGAYLFFAGRKKC